MWDSLQNLLPKIAVKYHFKKALEAIDVCREYRSLAPRLLRGDPLNNTTAKSYKDRVLILTVKNSIWAQELQMHSHLIQNAINQKLGEKTVEKIKILVADGPAPDIQGEKAEN